MLELAILGLLLESPMHGYIPQTVDRSVGRFGPFPTGRSTRRCGGCSPMG